MKNNFKTYSVIAALTEKEQRQLRKMLRSTYFTNRLPIRDLFDVLVKYTKKGKPMPHPEIIFQQVHSTETFDYARLRGLMSDLLEIIEKCFLINASQSDPIQCNLTLLEVYRKRKLEKAHKSILKKTGSMLGTQPKRNPAYFQQLLEYKIQQSKNFDGSKQADNLYLQDISDLEDVLFLSKKLRSACAQLSHQMVQKTDYHIGLLSTLLPEINQEKYLKIPAISIYYYCYLFLTIPDHPEYFQKFKTTLNNHRAEFTKEDLSDAYRLAINYCIRKNNEGDSSYMRELWELYKNGLEQGILLLNHFIPRFTFDNALTAGLRLKEFAWAKTFIETQSAQLEPAFREQTITFNLGKLAYEQQKYDEALVHLQGADFKEMRINIVGKIMLIKIFYELASFEALHSHLDSFQQFIRRKEVNEYHRKNILNIIRYLKKIMALPAYDKVERKQLKEKIEQEELLSEKEWLLGKV